MEPMSGPRISFSGGDFLILSNNFIPKDLDSKRDKTHVAAERATAGNADFEFLSGNASAKMLTADELFFEGKLLPFSQPQHVDKLNKIILKTKEDDIEKRPEEASTVSWFVDDDPSPRPPKCTLLWKELLKLKRQNSSNSRMSVPPRSSVDSHSKDDRKGEKEGSWKREENVNDRKGEKEGSWKREENVKRIKKGLGRTRSLTVRIRPVLNTPNCTQGRINATFSSLLL
ncbi:uncharacterized protein LOC143852229 [Tasmannia lanceolata]|uniref:uncharacterized protein LOC143852229 n=1 Tax=Tasmannia lanceolata TaxID=3420 RepID=UPI004062A32F